MKKLKVWMKSQIVCLYNPASKAPCYKLLLVNITQLEAPFVSVLNRSLSHSEGLCFLVGGTWNPTAVKTSGTVELSSNVLTPCDFTGECFSHDPKPACVACFSQRDVSKWTLMEKLGGGAPRF